MHLDFDLPNYHSNFIISPLFSGARKYGVGDLNNINQHI